MFQKLLTFIRELINKMFGQQDIKQALNIDIAISSAMTGALTTWSKMYTNEAEWLTDTVRSLNLPAAIASEIARAVTIEMKVTIDGSARADYLSQQMETVVDKLREQVEKGAAKGGLIFKPYVKDKAIIVDYVQADQFFPIKFDGTGNITACVFVDQQTVGKVYYTRLEYHAFEDGVYTIKNVAFRSTSSSTIGQQISLSSYAPWADLEAGSQITGIDRPLFAYFKYPLSNNIDPTSPLGVSCYSRAVDLIKNADVQWSDLLWEFESGQRALYADVLAFKKDETGEFVLPTKRLYRGLNNSANIGDGDLFKEWTPTLREQNILKGLDAILKRIEYSCGLAYGTISDPQNVDKTATEIRASKQRTYSTIVDTQKALQNALDQLLYAMDVWATVFRLAPMGVYNAAYEFDDSIVVDRDAQFTQDLRLVSQGLMGKVEWRMRNFKEDEATAKKMIAAATEEQAPTDFFQPGA